MNILNGSIEDIGETDYAQIETLANTCPYLGGNAVYKARAIIGMFNPNFHYDDIVICNGQGVYKNGTTKLQQQLDAMEQSQQHGLLDGNGITIYPNPASTEITVSYLLDANEKASFIIYDMLGNKIKMITLYGNVNKQKINTSELSSGVYMYKYIKTCKESFTGKLVIE